MMAGVIETLAAETAEQQAVEARKRERDKASHDVDAANRDREARIDARRLAMKAAQGLTGRVIFPARWEFVPVEQHFRRCLRETIEGKVTIYVYLNGGYVESIAVTAGRGDSVSWENPCRRDVPPSRWPTDPGRDWFRRALIELGLI